MRLRGRKVSYSSMKSNRSCQLRSTANNLQESGTVLHVGAASALLACAAPSALHVRIRVRMRVRIRM